MSKTIFQYPGGKSHLSEWIIRCMPQHRTYVEAMGGSGAVLLNKQPSEVEVYNDLDSDLVDFFNVYREHTEELVEWLDKVPYSAELYEEWVDDFYYKGYRPVDPVRRAGRFFFLRYTQWGSKYHGKSGFGRSKQLNQAETFDNARDRLVEFSGRFDGVVLENMSYGELIPIYDSEETVWYFDPPYIGTEEYYRESDFNHQNFCKVLGDIEGYWLVSYDEIPEELEEYHVQRKKSTNFIDSGFKGEGKETTESLVTNFDPQNITKFTTSDQRSIHEMSKNGDDKDDSSSDGFLDFADEDTNGETDDAEGFLEDVI